MLKKVFFGGAAVAVVLALLFGRNMGSYASTCLKSVRGVVDNSVPLDFKIKNAKDELSKLDPQVANMKRDLAMEQIAVGRLRSEIEDQTAKLASLEGSIMRMTSHLENGSGAFVTTGGREYTKEQVEGQLKKNFDLFKTKSELLKNNREILSAREAGLEAARIEIEKAYSRKNQLEVEIADLESRLKLLEVSRTATNLSFDKSNFANLEEKINDIKTRIEVEEELANVMNDQTFADDGFGASDATRNITEEVKEYFNKAEPKAVDME